MLSVFVAAPLIAAQHLKLGLSSGDVPILSPQFNDKCLLRRMLPLSLDNLAFDLPQLV